MKEVLTIRSCKLKITPLLLGIASQLESVDKQLGEQEFKSCTSLFFIQHESRNGQEMINMITKLLYGQTIKTIYEPFPPIKTGSAMTTVQLSYSKMYYCTT